MSNRPIVTSKTIALDTSFLVGIADDKKAYDGIRRLLEEQAVLPVIPRLQVAEMCCGNSTVDRGKELLRACQGEIYELPPFYYLMQAEAYAGITGRRLSRRGLIGRTEREATMNLLRQLPATERVHHDLQFVSDKPTANDLFDRSSLDAQASDWRDRIEHARQLPKEGSDRTNKSQLLAYFSEADAKLEHRLWDLPPVEELQKRLDISACACLATHFNYFAALCCEDGPLDRNEFIDAIRVSIAPYVDVFTCDKRVADRLRKTGFAATGTVVCRRPQDVLDVCS